MRIILLVNPAAGRGRARGAVKRALEVFHECGATLEVHESRNASDLTALARQAAQEQPDLIVSAGGDGTHHYVINGLYPSPVPLGLLPLGRGNDFSQMVGMPRDTKAAASAMLTGQVREVDLARVGLVVYACVAGAGFDSIVNRHTNEEAARLSGSVAYLWSLLCCMKEYRPRPLQITTDAQTFAGEVLFAVVGNCRSYAGGIKVTPRADFADGLLDVCVVPFMTRRELVRWVPRAYRGEHLRHPRIKYFQARRVTLHSSVPMELFGDGEFIQALPATIETLPRALRVIAPIQPPCL
jgi:diacylglycerol kinase (ATP)